MVTGTQSIENWDKKINYKKNTTGERFIGVALADEDTTLPVGWARNRDRLQGIGVVYKE